MSIKLAAPPDNLVQTFQLESSHLRGRSVRLGSVINEIIERHNYPQTIAQLLAEAAALTACLATMLKFEGIFTLQTKGNGPLTMLVCDITSKGGIRAFAQFDAERLAMLGKAPSHKALLGQGYLAFTLDQGEHTDRYQGIVPLEGLSLAQSVQHYFVQSEQINTSFACAASKSAEGWRCGAIMLQHVPQEGGHQTAPEIRAEPSEDWSRANILLQSVAADELVSAELSANDLLYRLFHEEGVRVFPPLALWAECRCSRERVANIVRTLPRQEINDMLEEGELRMTCEFCSRTYSFNHDALNDIYAEAENESAAASTTQ